MQCGWKRSFAITSYLYYDEYPRYYAALYGVISPPKFKLLFATLLLWIIVRFHIPISIFYSSTLFIHNSKCIFQMQTWLGMRHSYSMFNVFIRCTMRYASNAIQQPCFLHSQTISIFCSQVSSFNMQHSCLSMQFWCSAVQSTICLLHNPILNFTLEWPDLHMVGRWTTTGLSFPVSYAWCCLWRKKWLLSDERTTSSSRLLKC